jgi:predicted anti-sigma-YlaC factor YlaD
MMHPDELLASYLDGTLEPRERAEVDAHLAGCERCRADLRSATRARNELRGAPKAAVPPDLRERILSRTASESAPAPLSLDQARARRRPAPAAWLSGIAAAAALLIGFFVFSSLQTSSQTTGVAERAGAPEANATAPGVSSGGGTSGGLVVTPDTNYDEAAVQKLAASVAAKGVQIGSETVGDASVAIACLTKGAKITGSEQAVELIQARFGGKPAYLGVYRVSQQGDAPGRLEVWVVSKADCSVLSFAQQLIRS